MRRIATLVACLLLASNAANQTYTWSGPSNSIWNSHRTSNMAWAPSEIPCIPTRSIRSFT